MSPMGRLQRAVQAEGRQHFANGYEMAGYYAAHFFECLRLYGVAPTQVGLLGGGNMALHGMLADSALDLQRVLEDPLPGSSAVVIIRPTNPGARHGTQAVISVRDHADGVELDMLINYAHHRHEVQLEAPVIIDIAGVALEAREMAKLACLLDYDMGWARYMQLHPAA
jgi:hypothetical protein